MLVILERQLKAIPTHRAGGRGSKFAVVAAEIGEAERLHFVHDFVGGIVNFEAVTRLWGGDKARVILVADVEGELHRVARLIDPLRRRAPRVDMSVTGLQYAGDRSRSVVRHGEIVVQRHQGQVVLVLYPNRQVIIVTAPVIGDFQLGIQGLRAVEHGNAGGVRRRFGEGFGRGLSPQIVAENLHRRPTDRRASSCVRDPDQRIVVPEFDVHVKRRNLRKEPLELGPNLRRGRQMPLQST